MAFVAYSNAASSYTDLTGETTSLPQVGLMGARNRIIKGNLALDTTQLGTVGNSFALGPIFTSSRIHSIGIQSDNLGTTLTVNVGLYKTDSSRTVVDADAYGSAFSIDNLAPPSGAITSVRADVRWESNSTDLNTMEQAVWEDGGEASDPLQVWLLALTITATSSPAAGDVAFLIQYTLD